MWPTLRSVTSTPIKTARRTVVSTQNYILQPHLLTGADKRPAVRCSDTHEMFVRRSDRRRPAPRIDAYFGVAIWEAGFCRATVEHLVFSAEPLDAIDRQLPSLGEIGNPMGRAMIGYPERETSKGLTPDDGYGHPARTGVYTAASSSTPRNCKASFKTGSKLANVVRHWSSASWQSRVAVAIL